MIRLGAIMETLPTGLLTTAADAVVRARRIATALGPESFQAWDLLELASGVERAAWNLEAELGSGAGLGRATCPANFG